MKIPSLINYRIRASVSYGTYYLMSKFFVTNRGGELLEKLEKKCKNNKSWFIKKTWWHFALLHYAYNYESININEKKCIVIHNVNTYNYRYWNGCFQGDAISRILYELKCGNTPCSIEDKFDIWSSFFMNPIVLENEYESKVKEDEIYPYYHPKYCPYNSISTFVGCKLYREFVRLNEKTSNYIEAECLKVFSNGDNILGVICRGTDYTLSKPKNHPRQPEIDDVIYKVRKYIKKYKYEYIYLATESKSIENRFREAFPKKILTNKRSYYDKAMEKNGSKWITEVHFDRKNDEYLKGIEYLSSLYILSRCKALIGGNCTGTRIAIFLNDRTYEHLYVFDRGLY